MGREHDRYIDVEFDDDEPEEPQLTASAADDDDDEDVELHGMSAFN